MASTNAHFAIRLLTRAKLSLTHNRRQVNFMMDAANEDDGSLIDGVVQNSGKADQLAQVEADATAKATALAKTHAENPNTEEAKVFDAAGGIFGSIITAIITFLESPQGQSIIATLISILINALSHINCHCGVLKAVVKAVIAALILVCWLGFCPVASAQTQIMRTVTTQPLMIPAQQTTIQTTKTTTLPPVVVNNGAMLSMAAGPPVVNSVLVADSVGSNLAIFRNRASRHFVLFPRIR